MYQVYLDLPLLAIHPSLIDTCASESLSPEIDLIFEQYHQIIFWLCIYNFTRSVLEIYLVQHLRLYNKRSEFHPFASFN